MQFIKATIFLLASAILTYFVILAALERHERKRELAAIDARIDRQNKCLAGSNQLAAQGKHEAALAYLLRCVNESGR